MLDVIVKYITDNYIEALGVLLSFCYMFFSVRGQDMALDFRLFVVDMLPDSILSE